MPNENFDSFKNSDGFREIRISSNKAVNELARQQELCLKRLIERINKPFRDKWEWAEWHRNAIALQLSQHKTNSFVLDNQALWNKLINPDEPIENRELTVFIIHNYLEKTFAHARLELAEREKDNDPI